MNLCIITNVNAGKDADVRTLENNIKVATFPVAHTQRWTQRDGTKMEKTEWFNVVAWRGLAVLAEKAIKKGTRLNINGSLQTRSWTDKDGNKHYVTEVLAEKIEVLSVKQNEEAVAAPAADVPAPAVDDLPPVEEELGF